jgi:O-succinylbenzoic acid--CoA ligase
MSDQEVGIKQKTSGTTGEPKEIILERSALALSARRTLDYFSLHPGDSALLCLPVQYIAGKMMIVRALLGGLNLLMTEPHSRPLKDAGELKRPLSEPDSEGRIDFCAMVPLQLTESLANGDDLSILSTLLLGGGEIQPVLRELIRGIEVPSVFESFGSTETYTHFALRRINGKKPENRFRLMDGVNVSLDEWNRLHVEIPGITRQKIPTNDLVRFGKDGKSFEWIGRKDNVINTGGVKISPESLEQKISRILGLDCLILPEPDEKLGQRLVLVLETGGASEKNTAISTHLHRVKEDTDRQLLLNLKGQLQKYEVPKRIVRLEQIPRNASFKPDRLAAIKLI